MFKNRIKHKVVYHDINDDHIRELDFLSLINKITKNCPKFHDLTICMNFNTTDLYSFFIDNKIQIDKNIAECIYISYLLETNNFSNLLVKDSFKTIDALVKKNIDIKILQDNLYNKKTLSSIRIIPKVLDTLELYFEGQVGLIYLKNRWLKQTGATIEECEDILDTVNKISIVKVVLFLYKKSDTQTALKLKTKHNKEIFIMKCSKLKDAKPLALDIAKDYI
jgi:phosphoesterase RecJ-like protein